MNLLDILKNPNAQEPAWRGQWARIWLQPCVFSAQRYLVGMAMLDADRLRDFRLISGTEKFGCLYGDDGRTMVDLIIAQARQALAAARDQKIHPDAVGLPPGVTLEAVGMAADRTPELALESAMVEAEIPMEPRPEQMRAPRFKSRKAEDVVTEVLDAVKTRMGYLANDFIREAHFGAEQARGTVNLVRPDAVGLVVSGWYANSQRVQLELLLAVNVVEGYMATQRKTGQAAVFLLAPTVEDGLPAKVSQEIDSALHEIDSHLRSRDLRSAVRNRARDLADDVAEWAVH